MVFNYLHFTVPFKNVVSLNYHSIMNFQISGVTTTLHINTVYPYKIFFLNKYQSQYAYII